MKEKWMEVSGYDGKYLISGRGDIISFCWGSNGRKLKYSFDKNGYTQYRLYKNGKAICYRTSVLVAKHFIENIQNKKQVNHKNGIKADNRCVNLEWVTPKENVRHAYDVLRRKGKSGNFKINKQKADEIRNRRRSGESIGSLSETFKLCRSSIYMILAKKYWL